MTRKIGKTTLKKAITTPTLAPDIALARGEYACEGNAGALSLSLNEDSRKERERKPASPRQSFPRGFYP
jgi:hypothetical protein